VPVSTVYLDVDGRRSPRKQDVLTRAEVLVGRLRAEADGLERRAKRSVAGDAQRITTFLDGLDRGRTRGVAMFSCSSAGWWEEVRVHRSLPDRARVAPHAYVLPLEALVQTYESFCTSLVDREKARIFLARMGDIQEEEDLVDVVPGQHDQGGWSQARFARHIEEHTAQHLKRVAERLLRVFERRTFDHLILAGPEELVPEFERGLHDYLRRRVLARINLPMTASPDLVLERSLAIEEALELERERGTVERLVAESAAGRGAVVGLEPVLEALNEARVETLVVPFGLFADGVQCEHCGRLDVSGGRCPTCGHAMHRVPDVVEASVEVALSQDAAIETLTFHNEDPDAGFHDIGAILRY